MNHTNYEKALEKHVAEGRKIVQELVRKLGGSPGIDVMRGLVISDARKWLDDTRGYHDDASRQ